VHELDTNALAEQFVDGLDYPLPKAEIIAAARKARLPELIALAIEKIADRDYQDADDLTRELNAAS
jgi:hypothetical protein